MLLWIAAAHAGCAWKGEGIVTPAAEAADDAAVLTTSTGETLRLKIDPTSGDDRLVAHLDGHLVAVEGRKLGRGITVREWSIVTGLHGMNVWIGRLVQQGGQLGLMDHNSGAFYVVERDAREELSAFIGRDVLLEGYVAGAHEVSVLHYEVFDDD